MHTIGTWWLWITFFGLVFGFILVDLFLLGGRRAHRVGVREAAGWSIFWVTISLAFAGGLWLWLDESAGRTVANQKALEFLTGYLIEKSLAVDNVFVWLMLFGYFAVPPEFQRRVLLYGVIGAIALRTVMIFAGAALISEFHWVLYLFGAFLLITGIKMAWLSEHEPDIAANPAYMWMRRHLPLTPRLENESFSIVREGKRWFTPLFLVLVLVELTDVIFALDSIPAIFAITTDPFIVLSSNIFAILGLRAMYFLFADFAQRFVYLKQALAAVLCFIGTKMLIAEWYHIPTGTALGVVGLLIGSGIAASLWRTRGERLETKR